MLLCPLPNQSYQLIYSLMLVMKCFKESWKWNFYLVICFNEAVTPSVHVHFMFSHLIHHWSLLSNIQHPIADCVFIVYSFWKDGGGGGVR